MDLSTSFRDLLAMGPFTVVVGVALVVILVDALSPRSTQTVFWLSVAGFLTSCLTAFAGVGSPGKAFGGMVTTGGYASYFAMVFSVAGLLSVLLSRGYLKEQSMEHGEYYALLLLSEAGMMLMAASADLIMFFLGLELMSICFYILAGFARGRPTSNEAALKYFLLGAFATGFLLYGISLVYGSTGTTAIATIVEKAPLLARSPLFVIGLGLLVIGLAFKVAAVPFHMWVPDVYEGAPTTVSGFMSTGGKAAAFSAFLLIFAPGLIQGIGAMRDVLAAVAALSMVTGNVLAISQTNIKRMLAYSSIAHAGYILTGIVAANVAGTNGVLYYLLAYTVMNIGAFGVLGALETAAGGRLTFDEYAGLSGTKPLLAGLMALFMFSLAGIPPFAGFFGKYYVFAGAVQAGYTWLAIVGVLMSVVSAYYYLRLVVQMYFRDQTLAIEASVPALSMAALVVSAMGILGLGMFPSSVLGITTHLF
jgi:NADH-quinone oxidoreductase subunit N